MTNRRRTDTIEEIDSAIILLLVMILAFWFTIISAIVLVFDIPRNSPNLRMVLTWLIPMTGSIMAWCLYRLNSRAAVGGRVE